MYKASTCTLLKCIVFLVLWTCCRGKKSPKSQFYVDFGLVVEVLSCCYRKAIVRPAITILTIDMSLMRMFSEGPEVSLNGSPTVSPTIVAL